MCLRFSDLAFGIALPLVSLAVVGRTHPHLLQEARAERLCKKPNIVVPAKETVQKTNICHS